MRNTVSSGRSKTAKDKGSTKSSQNNTVKSEGPPVKQIQATAEQVAFNNMIQTKDTADEQEQKKKINKIIELTHCSQEMAEIALYDSKNDMECAVTIVFEGAAESEWRETGKKKKKQKSEPVPAPSENHVEKKADKREVSDRNDRDNRDRNKEDKENDMGYREPSDNYRRPRRNDNRPPRLSRGRGRPDRAGDRPDRDEEGDRDDNRDRSFSERGRGRGRGGLGPRRGRGGSNFRTARPGFDKPPPTQFENGPEIDTWTNETAVIGEKEPKISKWGDKEDWSEDIDSWTGSLAETKVFTASSNPAPEPAALEPISNTFDIGVLYPKQQNEMAVEDNYISQFNQQATESIKNSIGIGSGPSSSLQNSMNSQTASNVSALVSLQQTALHDNLGSGLSELTGNGLSHSGIGGGSLGTSLGGSLASSITGNPLHSGSLSGELTGNGLGGSMSEPVPGGSLTGSSVSDGSLAGSQAESSMAQSQAAMMQQRAKPQKTKLPPPSKIPASAVEMPDHMMTGLDGQFGNLEFGFSFGGNESGSSAFSSAETNSTSSMSTHQQPSLSKAGEALMSSGLDSSPRSTLYQQSPYTTPTKQTQADNPSKINSPPEPLQMPGGSQDLKSSPLVPGQSQPASLPTTYQSSSYQSQKPSTAFQSSNKPGAYPGPSQPQQNSNQFSSQYRQSNFPSGSSQFPSGSQYQSPPSGYQSSQQSYQSAQSGFQSNQAQFPSGQSQFQNFQSGSTFPNQSSYSSNQASQSSLYPSTTSSSFSNQSQQSSLYSQNTRQGSYSNQPYLNHDHGASSGTSFQTSVTKANSPFKDNQSGASAFRDNISTNKSRESTSDNTAFSRDTNSASSFSDNQSMSYNRDSQSVGSAYGRDPSNAYKRDSKSASGSYPRDSSAGESAPLNRDSQSSSASYTSRDGQSANTGFRENQRDSQSANTGFRENQTGAAGFGTQAGSYPRDSNSTQSQSGFSAKTFRNSTEVSSSLQNSLTGNKLMDSFSNMTVNEGSLDGRQSSQGEGGSSSRTPSTTPASTTLSTTVTSSTTTKISTLPSSTAASSSKGPPNLPPGVPLMAAAQQYIMGQAGQLPFYNLPGVQGMQQPLYANMEDFQYRLPPHAANNLYELTAAAGLQIPPTSLSASSSQQPSVPSVPTVPYTGSQDNSGKLNRLEAQSPTGTVPTTTPNVPVTGQAGHQQQPFILNYGYYYPPNMFPGNPGIQGYPMIPMPQVTNAAHAGSTANTQYQQKNFSSHVQYGTNKVYDELSGQSGGDFNKSPYGSSQSQPKPSANSTVTGSSDISSLPGGYSKTHPQAFDKQGFHAGTPPPFNLQMAAGQLATGTQAGSLGAHTTPYAPYVPMMPHQPHSQMLHHPLQDTSSSSRGGQQTGGQSKTSGKTYSSGSNWGPY
ncbi:protein lingerer-like [Mya arenaria]|uniref:protein lingerer-like n=1 Tax=Mya arenaria TaxID=6604 RepID=UPI0022E2A1BC|nr:protein lingerer-like [Mya arenaria]